MKRRVAEPGDLVFYFGSEWTVHSVDENAVALLRKHNDSDLTGNTLKVHVANISPPWAKARERW